MPKTIAKTVEAPKKRPAKPVSHGVDVRELLKAGAHFGHKTSHWNPKMKPFIHSERGGIYIIDLIQTTELLNGALAFLEETAASGKQILFVGAKRHMRDAIKAAADVAGMPYVNQRWFGGMLTNFDTISTRVKHLLKCEEQLESGELAETASKRELGELKEEIAKLNINFGGIKTLKEVPAALFVADCLGDRIAVQEAQKLGVPVVGVLDTNANPTGIDYPVPANDDAVATISLIGMAVAEAVKAGKARRKPAKTEESEPAAGPKARGAIGSSKLAEDEPTAKAEVTKKQPSSPAKASTGA